MCFRFQRKGKLLHYTPHYPIGSTLMGVGAGAILHATPTPNPHTGSTPADPTHGMGETSQTHPNGMRMSQTSQTQTPSHRPPCGSSLRLCGFVNRTRRSRFFGAVCVCSVLRVAVSSVARIRRSKLPNRAPELVFRSPGAQFRSLLRLIRPTRPRLAARSRRKPHQRSGFA